MPKKKQAKPDFLSSLSLPAATKPIGGRRNFGAVLIKRPVFPVVLTAFAACFLFLTLLSGRALANDVRGINVSTTNNRPMSIDRLLYTALREAGYNVNFTVDTISQGFLLANDGERDAVAAVVPNMEEQYPNLRRVPVVFENLYIDALTREGSEIEISSWNDLEGLTVATLTERVYVRDSIPETAAAITSKDSNKSLLEGLLNEEYDVAVLSFRSHETVKLPAGVERARRLGTMPEYLYVNKRLEPEIPQIADSLLRLLRNGRGENILNDIQMPEAFQKKTVVHIVSSNTEVEREEKFFETLRGLFQNDESIEWYTVELDSKRFPGESSRLSYIASILRQDCVSRNVSAIIVSGDESLAFLKEHYLTLFRNVPVIFYSVNDRNAIEGFESYFTGVFENLSAGETVEAALSLFPETENVYVINDNTGEGAVYRSIIEKELEALPNTITVEYSQDKPLMDLIKSLSSLSDKSIVLIGSYFRDANGQYYSQNEMRKVLGDYCGAPIFTVYSAELPYGALGGKCPDYGLYAEEAAAMLDSVLKGASLSGIPPVDDHLRFNRWVFDSKLLAAAGIAERKLPSGSEIINKTPSIRETNPSFAYSMMALVSLSAVAIVGLALFLYRFRRQNQALVDARKHLHTAEEMLAKDEKIKEVKERLESIISNAPVMYMLMLNGRVVEMNAHMKNADIVDIGGDLRRAHYRPERYDELLARTRREGILTNEVVKYVNKSGEVRRFLANIVMVDYNEERAVSVWAIDIEDDEKKKDELTAARQSFQTMLDTMPVAVVIADTESYDLVYCNNAGRKMLELSPADDAGKLALSDIFDPSQPGGASPVELSERIMDASDIVIAETRVVTSRGKRRDVRIRATAIDFQGKRSKIAIMTDLSREKELQRMQDNLQTVLDTLPIPVRITDLTSKTVLYANRSCAELFRYAGPERMYGLRVTDLLPKLQSNGTPASVLVDTTYSQEGISSEEIEYVTADGEIIEAQLLRCHIEYMGRRSILGIIRDLAVEREYRRMQVYLQTVLDFLPVPVRIYDIRTKNVVYANKSALELFGFTSANMISNVSIADFIVTERLTPGEMDKILDAPATAEITSLEIPCRKHNGEAFDARITDCIIDYKGSPSCLGVIQDLTAEKEYRQMLLNAAEREKEANQLKSRFLVNMSHEIRTPMNAIIGLTEIELRKKPPKETKEVYKKINTSAKELLQIINDILDLSKIESDKMEIHNEEFGVEELLNSALLVATPRLDGKNVEMILNTSMDMPRYIIGDRTRLWQVLKNFLDNSAKFTNRGKIVLTASVAHEKSDDENVTLRFVVEDTGIGMSQEQLESVFLPYEQFYSDAQKRYSGTGLGMPISKQLCELMGGQMEIWSTPGVGTKIEALIPFARSQSGETQMQLVKTSALKGLNVLIVDDDNMALEIMSALLKCNEANIVLAHSGREAMQTIFEYRDMDKYFDIILLDYMMEGLSGLETARQIHMGLSRSPKLLMVTAYQKQLLKRELDANGIDEIIEKPFVPSHFISKLCETLGYGAKTAEGDEDGTEESFTVFNGAGVLLVEDNRLNQEVAAGMLKYFGITPVIADNGQRAVEILSERADSFDLILMDLKMPVMDGYEAARTIRSDPRFANVPIISLTADAMVEVVDECMAAGMNDHLTKPIEIDKLHRALLRWLPENRRDDNAQVKIKRQSYLADEGDRAKSEALLRFQGDEALYNKALQEFAEELPEEWPDYQSAVENKEETLKIVHNLKGVAGNLSEMDIYYAASRFEGALRNSRQSADIYGRLVNAAKDARSRITGAFLEKKSAKAKETGTKQEFSAVLAGLAKALANYDPAACTEYADKLREKNWPGDDIKIRRLLEYTDTYEFDDALSILKDLKEDSV